MGGLRLKGLQPFDRSVIVSVRTGSLFQQRFRSVPYSLEAFKKQMSKAIEAARKAAGLPPETEAEKLERLQETKRIKGCGQQMQTTGCGLTIVGLLVLIVILLL